MSMYGKGVYKWFQANQLIACIQQWEETKQYLTEIWKPSFHCRLENHECYNARIANEELFPMFQDVTNQMFDKQMKINMKINLNEAKEFYFFKNKSEKDFIDLLVLFGLEGVTSLGIKLRVGGALTRISLKIFQISFDTI